MQAVQWMRRGADFGFAAAQFVLAMWYQQGACGLPVNRKEALRLSRLGAAQGEAVAMRDIGHDSRWGVDRDLDEACIWYSQAVTLGDDAAKECLRMLAHEGHAPSAAALRMVEWTRAWAYWT